MVLAAQSEWEGMHHFKMDMNLPGHCDVLHECINLGVQVPVLAYEEERTIHQVHHRTCAVIIQAKGACMRSCHMSSLTCAICKISEYQPYHSPTMQCCH